MIFLKDLDFELPDELVAQHPEKKRDESRLLVYDRLSGQVLHEKFRDVVRHLNKDEIVIFNDTRVFPARLFGRKTDTGSKIEVLLLLKKDNREWEALLRPARRIRPGTVISLPAGRSLTAGERIGEGTFLVQFDRDTGFADLESLGQVPLPPYIKKKDALEDIGGQYQTVYAREYGAAAAPTAGLHFTPELLENIKEKGVKIGFITLHISYATFAPIRRENVAEHRMHKEYLTIPKATVDLLASNRGSPVTAVGTTVVRALESAALGRGKIREFSGTVDTYIRPGYPFQIVDRLITNFHLPRSTLLLLVSAFTGLDRLKDLYRQAIEKQYRFFSFGDAMMIL